MKQSPGKANRKMMDMPSGDEALGMSINWAFAPMTVQTPEQNVRLLTPAPGLLLENIGLAGYGVCDGDCMSVALHVGLIVCF